MQGYMVHCKHADKLVDEHPRMQPSAACTARISIITMPTVLLLQLVEVPAAGGPAMHGAFQNERPVGRVSQRRLRLFQLQARELLPSNPLFAAVPLSSQRRQATSIK